MRWLLLLDPPAPGAWNMALDEALLASADRDGLATLRLYRWQPATLSFGRNEPALRRYDRDAIARQELATVRRPTGGRAVWHHDEVTYAIAAPVAAFGTLPQTYREIHALLADALRSLGASVSLAADRPAAAVGAGACFAAAAGGEVMDDTGRKVVGSAQVRAGGAFLQHGSMLLTADQDVVSSVTRGDAEPPSATGIRDLLPDGTADWDLVAGAVVQAAARRWGTPRRAEGLPAAVREHADTVLPRFLSADWTWRR